MRGSLNIKPPRRSLLATGAVLVFALLVGTGATLLNQDQSAQAADTGTATLNNVAIVQAGTGLAGEDTATNTVLINNTVKWQATYQIATAGTITLTATLPINNTFDAASVSSSAGCTSGSALSKSSGSSTNNVATCVINPSATGSLNWAFSAAVWGANNEQIQPTLTVSGQTPTTQPPAVKLKGEPNYRAEFYVYPSNGAAMGINKGIRFGWLLYAPLSDNGVIGLEPLKDGNFSFTIDTSDLPSDLTSNPPVQWSISGCEIDSKKDVYPDTKGNNVTGMTNSGSVSCSVSGDKSQLTVTVTGAAIGVAHYPTRRGDNVAAVTDRAYYSGGRIDIDTPVSLLSPISQTFRARFSDFPAVSASNAPNTVVVDRESLSWVLNSNASGVPYVWFSNPVPVGWAASHSSEQPLYPGEDLSAALVTQLNIVPDSDAAHDMYYCMTWNPSQVAVTGNPTPNENTTSGLGSDYGTFAYEFGVIGTDMNTTPSSAIDSCGEYGDKAGNFFSTLADAQAYTKGGYVNAVRLNIGKVRAGIRDLYMAFMPMKMTSQVLPGDDVKFESSAKTDDWTRESILKTQKAVSGIVRNSLAVSNDTETSPSIAVGGTEHVVVTPYTYGMDSDVTVTVAIPKGLTPVDHSFEHKGGEITPTETVNPDGSRTLVFNLGTVGSASDKNTALPQITFDVAVDTTIAMPQTMTITSQTNGDGTYYASEGWRLATASIAVAAQSSFGYTLSQSTEQIQPGESITYNFADYNSTNDKVNDLDQIIVLPYNKDGRGTSGLSSYEVSKLAAITNGGSNLTFYYTTDTNIRGNSAAAVSWTPTSGAVPSNAVAVRWSAEELPGKTTEAVQLVLSNIVADNNAVIALDITRVSTTEFKVNTDQSPVSATYKKASLSGTVYRDTDLSGDHTFPADIGLTGYTVRLKQGNTVITSTTTNTSGQYSFGTLPSGTYSIELASEPENMTSNGDVAVNVELGAGVDKTNLNLGFVLNLDPADDSAEITIAANNQPNPAYTIDVLANDKGANGEDGTGLTISEAPYISSDDNCFAPLLGVVEITTDTITYTANPGTTGVDSFCYQVSDSFNQTAFARVIVTLESPPIIVAGIGIPDTGMGALTTTIITVVVTAAISAGLMIIPTSRIRKSRFAIK